MRTNFKDNGCIEIETRANGKATLKFITYINGKQKKINVEIDDYYVNNIVKQAKAHMGKRVEEYKNSISNMRKAFGYVETEVELLAKKPTT